MKIGFIGLGNVGSKLAGSLRRNGFDLLVRDIDQTAAAALLAQGAEWADSPRRMAQQVDTIITCLPSPAISAAVMEGEDGVLAGLGDARAGGKSRGKPRSKPRGKPRGKLWLEMSTTDQAEVRRLGKLVEARGGLPMDAPVSGGCHRAATGNIAIFAGGTRAVFDKALPILTTMGRRVLHTGALGSASILKVVTNYLATANLVSLCEALATCKMADMDLNTTYEAIRISSGNSFVHETESQVILNGSRDINFTMNLVRKDIGLFSAIAEQAGVPLELAPLLVDIFKDGEQRYGAREWSPNIIKRLEEACGVEVRAPGFPAQIDDHEPEAPGYEIKTAHPR